MGNAVYARVPSIRHISGRMPRRCDALYANIAEAQLVAIVYQRIGREFFVEWQIVFRMPCQFAPASQNIRIANAQIGLAAVFFRQHPRCADVIVMYVRVQNPSDRVRIKSGGANGLDQQVGRLRIAGIDQQKTSAGIDQMHGNGCIPDVPDIIRNPEGGSIVFPWRFVYFLHKRCSSPFINSTTSSVRMQPQCNFL